MFRLTVHSDSLNLSLTRSTRSGRLLTLIKSSAFQPTLKMFYCQYIQRDHVQKKNPERCHLPSELLKQAIKCFVCMPGQEWQHLEVPHDLPRVCPCVSAEESGLPALVHVLGSWGAGLYSLTVSRNQWIEDNKLLIPICVQVVRCKNRDICSHTCTSLGTLHNV